MPAGPEPSPGDPGALADELNRELDGLLADDDARRVAHYPGDPTERQPVHTVYVPGSGANRSSSSCAPAPHWAGVSASKRSPGT
jgi:hypothetical protein